MNATAIAFNTSSAVSEANATALFKTPFMSRYLRHCNDMCLFGSFPLLFATFVLIAKRAFVSYDGSPVKIFLLATGAPLMVGMLYVGFRDGGNGTATHASHAILFGGLMADEAVCPEGEADGVAWAHRTSGEHIQDFIFSSVLDRITDAPQTNAKGVRVDKKLAKKEVPARIRAMLEDYSAVAQAAHAKASVGATGHAAAKSGSVFHRRKLPLLPGQRVPGARGAVVAPMAAGAAIA
jgi:hypothetical protein